MGTPQTGRKSLSRLLATRDDPPMTAEPTHSSMSGTDESVASRASVLSRCFLRGATLGVDPGEPFDALIRSHHPGIWAIQVAIVNSLVR
jgi:hypothetical protein